jgi:hypothetical protein
VIIRSDFLTEGLFGQVLIWMLEILPYVDQKGWKPHWEIRTKHYGAPPEFSILPGIIVPNYAGDDSGHTESLEQLQKRHQHNFKFDFHAAQKAWATHFRFTADVQTRLDQFWSECFPDNTVLGIHYRGTDKNVDTFQTNRVTQQQFLCAVEDFLGNHPDVTGLFVASDDSRFIEAIQRFPNVHFYNHNRAKDDRPLWNQHECSHNQAIAKDAILDCLTLARCQYGLKCMSQLSAFAKIINPALDIYRISACKPDWFPEAYIPRYHGYDPAVRAMLGVLQRGDVQEPLFSRAWGAHRRVARIAKQAWRRRHRLMMTRK